MSTDGLFVSQLHDDVEKGVGHHVTEEDGQKEGSEIGTASGQRADSIATEAPIDDVEDGQKEKTVDIHGLKATPVATYHSSDIVNANKPYSLENTGIHLPSTHVVNLKAQN